MHRIFIVLFFVWLCASVVGASPGQKTKPRKSPPKVVEAQPESAPAPQQPPPPPVTPEHGPSSPPEVNFQDGKLTIVARNSTMGDVLTAVKQKTGAAVDMPAVSSERVVGQFGPGAPRDVLAQLLNGSHYDYVLLGSPADPGALNKIVLMARANGPEAAPKPHAQQPQMNQGLQAVPEVETEQSPDENANEVTTEVPQPEEEPQAEQPQPDQPQPDQQEQPGQQNGPVVKTPEQLLRELQQQQQQQQEQQQGQPQGAPGQPPQ
jgi:hypothetical protein